VESPQVALQGLQPVARRHAKVFDARGCIEDEKLPERRALDLAREALHALSAKEAPGATDGEACNDASQ
jgi:hypothetical protein